MHVCVDCSWKYVWFYFSLFIPITTLLRSVFVIASLHNVYTWLPFIYSVWMYVNTWMYMSNVYINIYLSIYQHCYCVGAITVLIQLTNRSSYDCSFWLISWIVMAFIFILLAHIYHKTKNNTLIWLLKIALKIGLDL